MKILYLTATYEPSVNGVAIAIKMTMKALLKKGHEVTILAPENSTDYLPDQRVIRYASTPNLVNKDYPIPVVPLNAEILKLLQNKHFDIIHAHHPFQIAWIAKKFADAQKVPFIYTYHSHYEDYADIYLKMLPRKFGRSLTSFFSTDYVCKHADLIIAPSKPVAAQLHEKYFYTDIKVIPTGIDASLFESFAKDYLAKTYGVPQDKTILLVLSRLAPEKNLDLALETLAELPESFYLVMAGRGPHAEHLKALTKKLKLSNRVSFIGNVARADLSKVYSSADIFLFTSYAETQGLTIAEAMLSGLPTVAVESAIAKEYNFGSGFQLSTNDPKAFARSISDLTSIKTQDLAKQIKNKAQAYTSDETVNLLLQAYESTKTQKDLITKLQSSGWQSWSTTPKSRIHFPTRNFPPKKDNYLGVAPAKLPKSPKKIYGWCSWYAFFDQVTESKVLEQAQFINSHREYLPIEYLLIDAGWATWGDWHVENRNKFPSGIRNLTKKVADHNLKSGLWLAPFLVEKDSDLFKNHRDWLVSTKGILVEGFKVHPFIDRFWNRKRYILDLTNTAARNYLFECIHKIVVDLGIDLLKLDFLYAPYFDPNLSSKQAGHLIHTFLAEIKEKYPKVHINACGIPFATALNVVDSVRIGPDTIAPYLEGIPLLGKFVNNFKANQVIATVPKRQWFSSFWVCDPDVFVCRKSLGLAESTILDLQQTIINTKGNILLGDDLTKLSDSELEKYVYPLWR